MHERQAMKAQQRCISDRVTKTRWLVPLLCLLLVVGCVSLERLAPPVEQIVTMDAATAGIDHGAIARGRGVYLTRCIDCHNLEPVEEYSLDQWRDVIVPEMAGEAKLDAGQTSDLLAYLSAAHRFISLGGAEKANTP